MHSTSSPVNAKPLGRTIRWETYVAHGLKEDHRYPQLLGQSVMGHQAEFRTDVPFPITRKDHELAGFVDAGIGGVAEQSEQPDDLPARRPGDHGVLIVGGVPAADFLGVVDVLQRKGVAVCLIIRQGDAQGVLGAKKFYRDILAGFDHPVRFPEFSDQFLAFHPHLLRLPVCSISSIGEEADVIPLRSRRPPPVSD